MFGVGGRKNKSFHDRDDNNNKDNDDDNDSTWRLPKAISFHAGTDGSAPSNINLDNNSHVLSPGGEESVDELQETISNLKRSVMTHANSSAEAMERFNNLQNAHDALYDEHVHLQEQMDDAVELLKYLKEEKSNYEERIEKMNGEIAQMRGASKESVVSMTIENLTKEKMELESSLKDTKAQSEESARKITILDGENAELSTKIASLQKVKEAYEIQTRQQLESKTRVSNLETERGELLERLRNLEDQEAKAQQNQKQQASDSNAEKEEGLMKQQEYYEAKLQTMMEELEAEKAAVQDMQQNNESIQSKLDQQSQELEQYKDSVTEMQNEKNHLLDEYDTLKGRMDSMEEDVKKYESQEYEMKILNSKLSNSLSQIAQLQRDKRTSDLSKKSSNDISNELKEQLEQLESSNRELLQEKKDMSLYLEKMEETLMQKDELLEVTKEEHLQLKQQSKEELQTRLDELETKLIGEFDAQKDQLMERLELVQKEMMENEEKHVTEIQEMETMQARRMEEQRQELEEHYQQQQEQQQQQQQEDASMERRFSDHDHTHNELLLENESLKYKVEELKGRLMEGGENGDHNHARGEMHAQLEKEMQGRLAKRIAMQLHEQKIAMEAQIREELEAEYPGSLQQHANQTQADGGDDGSMSSSVVAELERKLRNQLLQVTEERERWKTEQEGIQKKILNSQAQFEKVRDGFKKKIDKEKARSKDLEMANEEKQVIITKLSQEYDSIYGQFQDLQAQLRADKESLEDQSLLNENAWSEEKSNLIQHHEMQLEEMSQREEQYATQIHELQNEINDLLAEQTTHENDYNAWEDEKETLMARYEEKNEELNRAMEDLEVLNNENADYVSKVEEYERATETLRREAEEIEESRVKFSVLQIEEKELKQELAKREEQNESLMRQMEQLNTENEELQQHILSLEEKVDVMTTDLTSTQDERDKLQDSLQDTSELCLELESKLSQYKREKDQRAEEYQHKIDELETLLNKTEAASASANLAISEKGKAVSAMADMEAKHRETVTELQKQISDSASQISKLIDQLSAASTEKASIISSLSEMKEKGEDQRITISELEASIEDLQAECDAANAHISELLTGNESAEEALSSLAITADESNKNLTRLEAEKAEAISKASSLEDTVVLLQDEMKRVVSELDASTSEVENLKSQLAESNRHQAQLEPEDVEADNSRFGSVHSLQGAKEDIEVKNTTDDDYDAKLKALQSEIDDLKETNARLATENANAQAQEALAPAQDAEASSNEYRRLQEAHKEELHKLISEMRDIKDNNVTLEEAIQDIQVEKEDLELENEELASKLADLTTQAKKMLLNNESLEEAIADQQIEYEDRIAELENELEELCQDDDNSSLRQKHKAALETIEKLKEDIDNMEEKEKSEADDGSSQRSLNRVEEENLELRQVIDHLSSENDAAKEIKFIVLELRAKNMELAESLRLAEEKNKSASDALETLRADNDRLRNDNISAQESDNSMPKMLTANAHNENSELTPENRAGDSEGRMTELEAELQHYKSLVSQMARDRNVFNRQLSDLMDLSGPSQLAIRDANAYDAAGDFPQAPTNERALVTHEEQNSGDHLNDAAIGQGALVTRTEASEVSSYAPLPTPIHHPIGEVEDQIRNLTIENGQLAQRLGGAVAEKEFAMTTLTKLGAKMEELIERNKLLSDLADMKSQHSSRGASYYSGKHSSKSRKEFRHDYKGRDPDAIGDVEGSSAYSGMEASEYPTSVKRHDDYATPHSYHDDPSTYSEMGSTIMSYEPSRIEPPSHEPSRHEPLSHEPSRNEPPRHEPPRHEPSRQLEPESASDLGNQSGGEFLRKQFSGGSRRDGQEFNNLDETETDSMSTPKLVKVTGGEYFGQLNKRGQKHGDGKMKYDNGNEYDGQWKHNKRDGRGTTKYASGNVYTGTWRAGKRHGFGVFHIKKTGDVYRGNWVQGLKSGPGVYEYADGELDVSFYQDDIRVGEGVRWSASRHQASRLVDGQLVGEEGDMPVEDATQLTKHLGFVV